MQREILIMLDRLVARSDDPSRKDLMSVMRKLVDHIGKLEGQVESLASALNLDATANVQSAFGIPEKLAQLLILLVDGKPRNKEALHAALYYQTPDIDMPEVKIIDTNICKLRKHIEPFNVEIGTVWGSGYKLTSGADVVMAAIENAEPSGGKIINLAAVR